MVVQKLLPPNGMQINLTTVITQGRLIVKNGQVLWQVDPIRRLIFPRRRTRST